MWVKQHRLFLSQKKFRDKESKASKLAPENQGPRILYSMASLCRAAVPKVTRWLSGAARAPVVTRPCWTVAWRKTEKRACISNGFIGSYGSTVDTSSDFSHMTFISREAESIAFSGGGGDNCYKDKFKVLLLGVG